MELSMKNYDIIISGAGIVGKILAYSLQNKGFSILIFDRNVRCNSVFLEDRRALTINHRSYLTLKKIGLWEYIEKYATPIDQIYTYERKTPFFLHFDSKERKFGFVIEFRNLYHSLSEIPIHNIEYKNVYHGNKCTIIEDTHGQFFRAKLLICCEGKQSRMRSILKIKNFHYNYDQIATVCNVEHRNNHDNIALEIFSSKNSGPLATLPLLDQKHSGLVLSNTLENSAYIQKMDDQEFLSYLNDHYKLEITSIQSKRQYFPLALDFVISYYKKQILLFGDTLHSIHPVAGQGLNLTLSDLDILLSMIDSKGILAQETLECFQRTRLKENMKMIFFCDSIIKLFASDKLMLKIFRRAGISIFNESKYLKNLAIKYATGMHDIEW